jgi:farnesyl-diphosphate farnesyltransferase
MRQGLDNLLAAVSRSFYLTIRVLPPALRRPVGLAYLLARASDTVADSAAAPPAARLEALRRMGDALRRPGSPPPDLSPFAPGVPDPAEQALLAAIPALWEALAAVSADDRKEILSVMEEILQGQALDLTRFGGEDPGVRALATAGELEDYTYRVAGCVGVFWTRICLLHLPGYAPGIAPEALARLGASFGQGLQLVNILRDAPADLAHGRCYLPADALGPIAPAALRTTPAAARPVSDRWMARTRERLADGLLYIQAIRPWRLRLACFLPWALGVRTVGRMERSRPLESATRVKVPRPEVRRLLFLGVVGALGNIPLRWAAGRVQKP